jgi:exopolysaccharide biosynthesis polyprenyl glycosylphosphotransferase
MLGKRRGAWVGRLLLADTAALGTAFLLAYGIRVALNQALLLPAGPLDHYVFLLGLILPIWLGLLAAEGGYEMSWLTRSRLRLAARTSALGLLLLTATLFFTRQSEVNRSLTVLFAAVAALVLALEREVLVAWLGRRGRASQWLRHALVVGTDLRAVRLIRALHQYPQAGWVVSGCVTPSPEDAERGATVGGVPVVGSVHDLPALLQNGEVVDEVFFAVAPGALDRITDALEVCEHLGIDTHVMADIYRPHRAQPFVEQIFDLPFYGFSPTLAQQGRLAAKRALDVAGAAGLLLATLPLLVALWALVRATSSGPAIFTQERVGVHGRRFRMLKLRTMVDGAEGQRARLAYLNRLSGPIFKAPDDPRITPIGRFLRRFSLDELPQLWNVLKGEMSLVGPRPLPVYEASEIKGPRRRRLAMRPGMTGSWQVSGRTWVDFDSWMEMDLQYVDRWSLGLDLLILLRTVPAVVRARGAY